MAIKVVKKDKAKVLYSRIKNSSGDAISFIGADDRPEKNWMKYVRKALKEGHDIVVGNCILKGRKEFIGLKRVELIHKGNDISYPGTNTTYRKKILDLIGGFDTSFITAEDMDLNYRAVDAGFNIYFEKKAVVNRFVRKKFRDFLNQSFWNGYGRKQLTLKHGKLWHQYPFSQMFRKNFSIFGLIRLIIGIIGYAICKITGGELKK